MNIAKKTSPISTNSHCTNSQQIVQNYYQQGFLYNKVRNLILIKGISNLTVYDVAMRIGSLVNLEPQNDVYVARGAMIGARKLLGNNIVRKNLINGVKLPITLFSIPRSLQS